MYYIQNHPVNFDIPFLDRHIATFSLKGGNISCKYITISELDGPSHMLHLNTS
jgi:hypothetical protein